MINLDKIAQIKECEATIKAAKETLQSLCHPSSDNRDAVLDTYKKLYPDNWQEPANTRVFLFVFCFNYCPSALTGKRLTRNLRKKLAKDIEASCPESVSIRLRNLLFCYRTFPAFRRKVDALQSAYEDKINNLQ